jgi:large subunit ribosomal protein L3
MRTGLIAHKLGMTQLFEKTGAHVAVTVLKVDPNIILGVRTQEKCGYTAVQVGSGEVKLKKVSKPLRGYYEKLGQEPKRHLKEFRVDPTNLLEIGTALSVTHFEVGQWIDVAGISIGKGFAGVMKRHGFGGLRATHGVSVSHRSHGSTGNRQDPGRVFKNKKMAGQMGASRVTKLNLRIQRIDPENGLIFIKGAVPGHANSLVYVRDAIKKPKQFDETRTTQ